MPNVMAAQPNIGGAVCESSVIPLIWLTPAAGVPCSNAANIGNARLGRNVNFVTGKSPSGGKSPRKCIYSVPAQETAKHRAKFGWPPVTDVAGVTKARRKTGYNVLGCPKLVNYLSR